MRSQFGQRRVDAAMVLAACLIGGLAMSHVRAAAPGEHPRLFFRVADLPRLRERAATAEGQAIVKRLRLLPDGAEGASLPKPPAAVATEKD